MLTLVCSSGFCRSTHRPVSANSMVVALSRRFTVTVASSSFCERPEKEKKR